MFKIGTLKKIAGIIKVISAIVSFAIVVKYEKINSDKYIKIGEMYDWSNK